jgi:hydrogenase nickel insertion protein HypA
MHEFSIMSSLVRAALQSAEDNDVKVVHSLTIQLGEMAFLAEYQMRFAFEVLSKDNLLEGAELVFEKVEAVINCPACGYEGPVPKERPEGLEHAFPIILCPECGGRPKLVKGKECTIRHMSAEV